MRKMETDTIPLLQSYQRHQIKKVYKNGLREFGQKEADRISTKSANEGTDLHQALTEWLESKDITTTNIYTLTRIKPLQAFLSKEIKILIGCDVRLYSDRLRIAGTFDLLYLNNNDELIMTDFKTSRIAKKEEWLEDYKCQITMYSMMFNESHTKLRVNKGMILFSYYDMTWDHFLFSPANYYEKVEERVNLFYAQHNTN